MLKHEFWRKGISLGAFVPSFLMLMPLGIPAFLGGMLSANCIMWCLPAARRTMESEAAGDKEMTFAGSNAGLLKWGGALSAVCILLSFIGVIALRSME